MAAVGTKLRSMQVPPRRSSTGMDGGSSSLLGFMSEASKAKAKQSLQRRSCQMNVKTERRRSIINSLDKYLEDDDQTESTYHQSSFSSGLSSETYGTQRSRTQQQQQQQQPLSRMATNLEDASELQQSPVKAGKPGKPPRNDSTTSTGSQRYRRRGSVTKFSLGKESSSHDIQDDSFHPEESSQHSFDTGSFADDFPIAVAETSSSSTLDERPIPVMKGQRSQHRPSVATSSSSVCSIDDRPLPMKKKTSPRKSSISSSDHVVTKTSKSSSGRPPAPMRSSSARSTASNGSIEDSSSIFSDEEKEHSKRNNSKLATALLSNKPKRHSTGTSSLAGLGSLPSASDDDDDLFGSSHHKKGTGNRLPPRRYSTQNAPSDDDDHRSCVSDGILVSSSSKRPPRQSRKSQSQAQSQSHSSQSQPKASRPFSLEAGLAFVSQHSRQDDSDCDVSVASTTANEENGGGGGGGRRYRRRGSVTKYSLDANDLDNASVASDGILANVPRPPRSDRRGSTTSSRSASTSNNNNGNGNPTARTSLTQSLHNFINHSSHHNNNTDDDDLQSVESTPANMGSANPPRQRYRRRGSVTKYSLET